MLSSTLILGDSWSDPYYLTYLNKTLDEKHDFPYWSEMFDAKIIAWCGCSNDWIFQEFIKEHAKYDRVIILWSCWTRRGIRAHYTGLHDNPYDTCFTVNYMNAVSKLRRDAFQMQALDPIQVKTEFDGTKDLRCQTEYYDLRFETVRELIKRGDSPKVHGWPVYSEIGGFTMRDLLEHEYGDTWQIDEWDGHPNGKGHEYIYEHIKRHV